MSFKEALKKLEKSKEYKAFKEKHKKAFLFSAFFVLSSDFAIETQQFSLFMPEKLQAVTFSISKGGIKHKTESFSPKQELSQLNKSIKIDLDKLQDIIKKEIEKQKIKQKLNKIIAILQTSVKREDEEEEQEVQIWNITCLFSNFKMLRLYIDCFSGKILRSEQASLFDFIQIKK